MVESNSPAGGSQTAASPPTKRRSALLWWGRLANYVLLGAAALIILVEIADSGVWRRLGMPLVFISMAIVNLANMHAVERRRAAPGTSSESADP